MEADFTWIILHRVDVVSSPRVVALVGFSHLVFGVPGAGVRHAIAISLCQSVCLSFFCASKLSLFSLFKLLFERSVGEES